MNTEFTTTSRGDRFLRYPSINEFASQLKAVDPVLRDASGGRVTAPVQNNHPEWTPDYISPHDLASESR